MWSLVKPGIELHRYVLGFHGIECIHSIFMTFPLKVSVSDQVLANGMLGIHGFVIFRPHISEAKFFLCLASYSRNVIGRFWKAGGHGIEFPFCKCFGAFVHLT